MRLNMWAVAQDQCKAYTEPDCMAALRFQYKGTREFVMVPFAMMKDYLVDKKGCQKDQITPVCCAAMLRVADADTVQALSKEVHIYYGTTSAGNILYTPCGMVCVGRFSREMDAVGCSLRGFYSGDTDGATQYQHLHEHLVAIKAHHVQGFATKACLDCYMQKEESESQVETGAYMTGAQCTERGMEPHFCRFVSAGAGVARPTGLQWQG